MTTKALIGYIAVVAGLGAGLVVQYQMLTKLRGENGNLRRQIADLNVHLADDRRPTNRAASANPQLSTGQFQELLRLRGEIGVLLRQQQAEAANRQPRSELGPLVPSPSQTNSDFVPNDSLANVGYATSESALQTFCWAWSHGDTNAILASLSPEGRARMEKEWGGKSEAERAVLFEHASDAATGYRIVNQKEISADEVLFSLYIGGTQETLAKFRMKRFGGEWKLAGD